MRFAANKFAKPLKELLEPAPLKTIFSNLSQILELHSNLVASLPEPTAAPRGAAVAASRRWQNAIVFGVSTLPSAASASTLSSLPMDTAACVVPCPQQQQHCV